MNSTQRSVWFRDFLPIAEGGETSNDAVVQSPVPLFSPSVTRDKTKVLHSVFSPQYNCAANQGHKPNRIIDNGVDKENAITSGNLIAHQAQFNEGDQESKPPLSKSPQADNLQHQTRHGRQVGTTPGMKINTTTPRSTYQKDIYSYHPLATSTKKPGLKINSSQSTFNWNTPQISPAMSSISGTTNRNIFRTNGSPASQKMKGDHQRDLNPLSSSPSSTSFYKDLPIRMLSIPNIQKCDSVTELTHIVTVLEKQNEYPSLLRFAKRRLTEARNKIECLKNTPSSHAGVLCPGADGKCIGTEHTNISPCSTEMERKQNDSSLVMSLSSDEDSDISSRGYKKITSFQQSQQKSLNAEEFLSDQPPEIQLRKQIQRLTQTIAEMENIRISEQTDFEEKIRCLNEAKEKAELKIITLEAAVLSDSARGQASHKQLIRSLEQLQKEKHTLQNSLSEERILRNENQKKASALEQRLLAEIKNLQSELKRNEIEVKKSRNTDKKQQELNQLLRSAQGKLEDMKKERDSMIRCMLEVIGDEGKGTKDVSY